MQTLALAWLVLDVTHSALDLGLVTAYQYLPMLLFFMFSGVIVDRYPKRRILYVTQSLQAVIALVLALLVTFHHDSLTAISLSALALGFVTMFDVPTRQTFVQVMVGPDLLPNAVSLNSALMNSGRAVGPAIAALAISTLGLAGCFYLNAGSFAAVLIALFLMRRDAFYRLPRLARAPGQLLSGLRYVRQSSMLATLLLAVAVVGTFAFNFTVTLPLLVRVSLGLHSASDYGWLMVAMGAGAVAGGLFVARIHPTRKWLALYAMGFGLFMAAVALAPSLAFAIVVMVPMGFCSIAMVASANSLIQLHSDLAYRGRVMSLYSLAFFGTTPIGALVISLVITWSSPRIGIMLGAILTTATGLCLYWRRETTHPHAPATSLE
jgi:predicted MFS family arabinose efflux permease